MKQTNLILSGMLLTGMLCTVPSGCGEDKKSAATQPSAQNPVTNHSHGTTPPPTGAAKWDPAKGTASVTGKVLFKGPAPERAAIPLKEDCAVLHDQPPLSEEVIVNDNSTLRNVFVSVQKGLEAYTFDLPAAAPTLDQQKCIYHNHVMGLQTGQHLVIKNSDGIAHNIKGSPKSNPKFNYNQPGPGEQHHVFQKAESSMVPVECNVHGWMKAYIGVLPHPFFAVTGADGSFSLKGLPPGTYEIAAWHEKFGTQTRSVTLKDKESLTIDFEFKPK